MSGMTLAKKVLTGLILCAALSLPVWAVERVKTDGKNKDSPVKVVQFNFQDAGFGLFGPTAEIRISTTVRNSSTTDDLKNVVIHLQLTNLAGEVVQEWTKEVPVMEKGAVVEFSPDVFHNFTFNNLQGGVMVEHDKLKKPRRKRSR